MPFVAQQQEKCTACNRTVYQTEKTVVEELDSKKVYHKTCIRCSFERCNKVLSLGEFSSIEGKFYCKEIGVSDILINRQLFAEKGNFEEGFGLEKKSKGTVVATPGTFVPVESTKQNVEKKETSEATAAKFRRFREDADSEKCTACGKTVYVTEKIVVEEKDSKKPYHKTCLKCSNEGCGRQLDLGSYVSQDGTIYCKPHFQQLFKSKGTFESIDSKDKWKGAPVVTEKLSFIPKEEEGKVQSEKNKTSEATAAKIRLWRQESDSEVCAICTKSVAPVERLVAEEKNIKKIYHNACFKCSQCGVKLDLRNYGSHEGSIYCRPHLKSATVTNVKPASSNVSVPSSFVPEVKEERSNQKSETPSHIAEKFKGLGNSEKCRSCGKSVYATEKLIVEELKQQHIYHKQCLRCSKCNIQLDASTYGSASGVIYCKVHLKQMSLPEQVKSENAYFVSPLRSASNDYVQERDQQQQQQYDDNDNDNQNENREEESSNYTSTTTTAPSDERREEEQEESVQEPVASTSTPSSYKPSPLQSPKESPVSSPSLARRQVDSEDNNNSDDDRRKRREERERQREEEERKYQEEKEKRDREREERKKRRDEEQDSNATEEDDAEKRKKEREERRKRREEEAQKELEDQEKKSEERRKRLEALKQ